MKLGKESLLAITEIALFSLGAIFFLLVVIIPSNPLWALILGILCGLAGAITWSCPLFVHMFQKIQKRITSSHLDSEAVAKKILEDDNLQENGYELHRAESYNNYGEEVLPDAAESQTVKTPTTPLASESNSQAE